MYLQLQTQELLAAGLGALRLRDAQCREWTWRCTRCAWTGGATESLMAPNVRSVKLNLWDIYDDSTGRSGVPRAARGVVTSAPRRPTRTLFGRAGLRLTRIVPSTGLISLVEAVPDSLS
jgi:hypothetical protein